MKPLLFAYLLGGLFSLPSAVLAQHTFLSPSKVPKAYEKKFMMSRFLLSPEPGGASRQDA